MNRKNIMKTGLAAILLMGGLSLGLGSNIPAILANGGSGADAVTTTDPYTLSMTGKNLTINTTSTGSSVTVPTSGGNNLTLGFYTGFSVDKESGNILFSNAANEEGSYLGAELYSFTPITGMQKLSFTIEAGTEEAPRPTLIGVYYGYGCLYSAAVYYSHDVNACEFFTLDAVGAGQTIDLNFGISAKPTHFSIFTLGGTTANYLTVSSIDITYSCSPDETTYTNLDVSNETELRAALEYYAFGNGATNGGTITFSNDISIKTNLLINKGNITIDGNSKNLTLASGFIGEVVNFRTGTLNVKDLTLDCTNLAAHAFFANGGATMNLENVTINNFTASSQLHPINFYGSGTGSVTNVSVHGTWSAEVSSHHEWCDVWVGDGRNVTISGGDIGSVCVNASEGGGTLSAGNVVLVNTPTIGNLYLTWCANTQYVYGEHAAGTVYMKATHTGTFNGTLNENPASISIEGLTEVKNSFAA